MLFRSHQITGDEARGEAEMAQQLDHEPRGIPAGASADGQCLTRRLHAGFHAHDVFDHSLAVLDASRSSLVYRWAAVLHDIGKPKTRTLLPGGKVAFHHHEVVGAKIARKRLAELRFGKEVVADVSRLVELHLRFHGYGDGE